MPNLNLKVGSLRGSAKFSTNREFKKMVSGNEALSHVLNTDTKKQNFYANLRQEAVSSGNLKNSTLQNVIKHVEKEKYLSSSARAELKKGLASGGATISPKERSLQEKHQAVGHRNSYAEIMGKRNGGQSTEGAHSKQNSERQVKQRIVFADSNVKLRQAEEIIAKRPSHEETAHKVYVDKNEGNLENAKNMIARITGTNK